MDGPHRLPSLPALAEQSERNLEFIWGLRLDRH